MGASTLQKAAINRLFQVDQPPSTIYVGTAYPFILHRVAIFAKLVRVILRKHIAPPGLHYDLSIGVSI
jgi:hypothetical protein